MDIPLAESICPVEQLHELEVATYATGWQGMLNRVAVPEVVSQQPGKLDITVLPIKLTASLPKTIGFTFPESPNFLLPQPKLPAAKSDQETSAQPVEGETAPHTPRVGIPPERRTRIAPPKDLIKLEDRLYFVLQPPLETMAATAQLSFPFQPFPYQLEGIAFLFPREIAILADEMGLGKTMQAITTVRMLLLSGQLRSVLLICPKPLVTNWVREFRQWAPEIPVVVVEGDQAKRQWMWQKGAAPVRIANYELMMRDRAAVDNPDQHFDLVILDEAQRIKNRNGTTAEVVRSIPRSRSWALTGTPIENSVEDLINIFEFLSPGYLRSDMHLKSISQATRDYILRRTKDKVLTEMPPKMFRDEQLELTPSQLDSYRTAEEEGVVQLTKMGDTVTIQHVFELVLRLKQICNFDPATGASSKMERLEADMEEIAASGQKAIIFSQWVETLQTLRDSLQRFVLWSITDASQFQTRWSHSAVQTRQFQTFDPDELRCRQRRFESAVLSLRVLVRSLVEPGRRRPGDQPRASHWCLRARHGNAHDGGRHHRATNP